MRLAISSLATSKSGDDLEDIIVLSEYIIKWKPKTTTIYDSLQEVQQLQGGEPMTDQISKFDKLHHDQWLTLF
jgi:hypothetical protein